MHAFEYHRPATSKEAIGLAAKKEEARYLAGGQSLVQAMKLRLTSPSDLIDLNAIGVQKAIPALAALAGMIGDRQVRHMGTLGGSLANSDPAADYPAAVLGLGATIITNKRRIEGDKYFKGLFETALEPGELITAVSFPAPKRAGYTKFKNPASRFALVGVFVADFGNGVRVGVTGAGPCAFRQAEMEKALAASFAPESLANITVRADGLNNDLHASPEYRAHLIGVMARRAVEAALR
jgi:carbon-monoxide dehydrogenase medium subunit